MVAQARGEAAPREHQGRDTMNGYQLAYLIGLCDGAPVSCSLGSPAVAGVRLSNVARGRSHAAHRLAFSTSVLAQRIRRRAS